MALIEEYYRTVPPLEKLSEGCIEEARENYRPYDLFSIRTRMTPYVRRNFGDEFSLTFTSTMKNNRMVMVIGVRDNNLDDVLLTDEQKVALSVKIRSLIAEGNSHVMLLPAKHSQSTDDTLMESTWISSILPYIDIDDTYEPYADDEGLYVSLGAEEDYILTYNELITDVMEQLEKMYKEGYVVGISEEVASDWGFERVNPDFDLYMATWKNDKISKPYGGLSGFIKSRMRGEKTIDVEVGNNSVIRHFIAELMDVTFVSTFARFDAKDLAVASEALRKIERIADIAHGQCVTFDVETIEEARVKASYASGYRTAVYSTPRTSVLSCFLERRINRDIVLSDVETAYLSESKIRTSERIPLLLNENEDS